jgi:hypothetical protein
VKRAIPVIVDNSAIAFMRGPITSPLRRKMARNAMLEVVAPDEKPNSKYDNTMGTPVKSNLSTGNNGKGILRPENFNA